MTLACAAAFAALFAAALAQMLCENTLFGNQTQDWESPLVRTMEAGVSTLEINEPDVCPESEAVGMKVTACDEEQAPRVQLLNATRGVVVRAGALARRARVLAIVYCAARDHDTDIPTATASPLQLLSLSSSDSSEVEPPSIMTSSTKEYLPPVKLESRVSSIDQSNSPPISTSFSSRNKDLLKDRSMTIFEKLLNFIFLLRKPYTEIENRAPAWKRRSSRRSSSPWLKLRSLPDEETRKSMPRSRLRAPKGFDCNDPWTPYEDDPLSSHWIDETTDPNPWYIDSELQSPYKNNFPWRIKSPQKHNWQTLHHEGPSPSSIKHDLKKQSRFVQSIHEQDPAPLLEWKTDRLRSERPALAKLLLMLQDREHQVTGASAHSVEDTEPWWSTQPSKFIENQEIPWQPDYTADYTADDGDAGSYSQLNYMDDRMKSPQVALAKKKEPPSLPRYHGTPPAVLVDAQLVHASQKPPQSSNVPPFENYFYNSPTPLTERPLLASTVRISLPWNKISNSMPLKSPLKLKKYKLKKLLESKNLYPTDHNYLSSPFVTAESDYPPEIHNTSDNHYKPEPYYPPETNNPSHLQSNPFSEAENYFPSEPHLPSWPHYPPETTYPSQPHYSSESGNVPSEPHYSSQLDNPPKPHIPLDYEYPLEHLYPSGTYLPSEPDYPSERYYPSETENIPSEPLNPIVPHYPSGPHNPIVPHYPSGPHNPIVPHYPSGPHNPIVPHYPSGPHNPIVPHYPSGPHNPIVPHYPSGPHNSIVPHYPSGPHFPSEPYYRTYVYK